MTISAKIIADSVSNEGKRITTLQLKYPRFIHSEFMTHRNFSRNASSSRAIPVSKMIQNIKDDPAMPIHWGKNIPGMKAKEENDETIFLYKNNEPCTISREEAWLEARERAIEVAEALARSGYHKQIVNRLLEPFQHIEVVCTATDFANFFHLRDHEDAQPEIRQLAIVMRTAMEASTPVLKEYREWHLPYVLDEEYLSLLDQGMDYRDCIELLQKVSAARCCRVSYLKHDGNNPSIEDDLKLFDKLVTSKPVHASPTEHQATPDRLLCKWKKDYYNPHLHGNFTGWIQFRKTIPDNTVEG